jgi:hypothetical protein
VQGKHKNTQVALPHGEKVQRLSAQESFGDAAAYCDKQTRKRHQTRAASIVIWARGQAAEQNRGVNKLQKQIAPQLKQILLT